LLALCALVAAQNLPKIAVYVTADNNLKNEKNALGTLIQRNLVKDDRYITIERFESFLDAINREHMKQRSGAIADSQIIKLGQQFGADFVCVADIRSAVGAFQVSASIINVETTRLIYKGVSHGKLENMDDLVSLSDKVIEDMFNGEKNSLRKLETYTPSPPPKPDTVKTYTVTTYASPSNGGTVSRNPYYNYYREGTTVTINANPSLGYKFAGWSGEWGSSMVFNNPITITANDNKTLTAHFQRIHEPKSETMPELATQKTQTYVPVSQAKTEPPNNESKYRRLDFKPSVEIGMDFEFSSLSYSESYYNVYEKDTISGFMAGGYFRLDLFLLELFIDGHLSKHNSNLMGGILAKIPITYKFIRVSPIIGTGSIYYDTPFIVGGKIDIGINKITYLYSEYLYGWGKYNEKKGSTTSFKIGGGLDVGLGKMEKVYVRTELLYCFIAGTSAYSTYNRDVTEKSTYHSTELRLGIGYKWGSSKHSSKSVSSVSEPTPTPRATSSDATPSGKEVKGVRSDDWGSDDW